jgi:hypothetical protein
MTLRGLPSSLFCLIAALTGSTHAALVCTPGNVVGSGSCQESVTLGQTVTTEFSNQPLSFDLWQSNAGSGFVETLQDVRFTFGGTVHYDAILKNFAASTKAGGMVIDELFILSRGSGPAGFLPTNISTTGESGLVFALSAGQAIPIQMDGTIPDVSVVYTTGLDEYSGPGTLEALVSGFTGYMFTSNPGQYAEVVLQTKTGGSYGTAVPMATVTYDFVTTASPVPEPATWTLVTAAIGIGAVLRRRRDKSMAGR